MMNLEVGDNDITADKDYKHIFKRIQNLCLQDARFNVLTHHIKLAGSQVHMHHNGVSIQHTGYLLNLNDRQDVHLAYELL